MSVAKVCSCRTTLRVFQDRSMLLFDFLMRNEERLDAEGVVAKKVDLPLCPLYAAAKNTPLLVVGYLSS